MILINFTHPLSADHLDQLSTLLGEPAAVPVNVPTQFDNQRPFAMQVAALVDSVGLTPEQWQTDRILVNPPAYAPVAAALIAELHGRMGYFPTLIRLRPVAGLTPPTYEVAELLNLQDIRDSARVTRSAT
jgi:hypothetical protein